MLGNRTTRTHSDVRAGCFVCNGNQAIWYSKNAQAVAARHHDATGHKTWCDVALSITYGEDNGGQGTQR